MPDPITITAVPCLQDNYAYLVAAPDGAAWVVDPSEATPVREALDARGLSLRGILATHHHWDHTHGIAELAASAPGCVVAAHAHDQGRIEGLTHPIDAPDDRYASTGLWLTDAIELQARLIPGHTLGAIAWLIPAASNATEDGPDIFTGDTLFAAGCGRLFEGTPAQMHASLQALTAGLPERTRLWFGHEYTASNLRFAAVAEPDNPAISERAATLPPCTTPTTVAEERATNPFVRSATAAILGERRQAKDAF